MAKIPNEIIPEVYKYAKLHYQNKLTLTEAKKRINFELGMNESSAGDFVMNLKYMLCGKKYSRTLNQYATDYFLKKIYEDFGERGILNATNALAAHINYYENMGNTKMPSQRLLFDKYSRFGTSELDTIEQEELIKELSRSKLSREELLRDLKSFTSKEGTKEEVKFRVFKRDNRIIAKLKILRKHQCQICNKTILKKDGTKYSEAAHIKPKYENGSEEPNNLLILCPNHHKEFDYGDRRILKHTMKVLEFVLNGEQYKLDIEIK